MNDSFDPRDIGTNTPSTDAIPPIPPVTPAAEQPPMPPQPPIAPPTPPMYAQPPAQPSYPQPPYTQPPAQPNYPQPPYAQPPVQPNYTQPPMPPYGQQPYGQPPYAPYYPPVPQPPKKSGNGMATASLLCGIASLVICCCAGLSPLLGGLAVLFALLSRKGDDRFSGTAIAGLICGAIGMVFGILILVAAMNGTLEEWSNSYMYEFEEEFSNLARLFLR